MILKNDFKLNVVKFQKPLSSLPKCYYNQNKGKGEKPPKTKRIGHESLETKSHHILKAEGCKIKEDIENQQGNYGI